MPIIPAHPVLVGLAAIALLGGTLGVSQLGGDFPGQGVKVEARAEAESRVTIHLANLCVTQGGLCTIRPRPAGEPCSCPNALRGQVFGRAYSRAALVASPGLMPSTGSDLDDMDFGAGH